VCTIVVLNRVSPDWPVVIGANRDELFARPAEPPRVWPGPSPFVAPIDTAKGGTWMGIGPRGFFVAVTNQRTWGQMDPTLESRGELVVDLLRSGSPDRARAILAATDARRFNPFNVIFGDASGLEVAYGRRHRAAVELAAIPAGVHVLPNDVLDCESIPKVGRIRSQLADAASLSATELRTRLASVLASRERAAPSELEPIPEGSPWSPELVRELDAVAIETPLYGTRSSSIVALGTARAAGFWYTHAPPHRSELADLGELLEGL